MAQTERDSEINYGDAISVEKMIAKSKYVFEGASCDVLMTMEGDTLLMSKDIERKRCRIYERGHYYSIYATFNPILHAKQDVALCNWNPTTRISQQMVTREA